MKALFVLCLLTVVHIQGFLENIFNFGRGDKIHGYSFEYHRDEDLLLIRNSTACFIVHADTSIADKLDHKDSRELLEDQLYIQIKADKGETLTDIDELAQGYQDNRAVFDCFRHKVYKLQYMST